VNLGQTKERSEERQKELALVEEKMLIKAEQRCKKTEERKQREQAKAASTTTGTPVAHNQLTGTDKGTEQMIISLH